MKVVQLFPWLGLFTALCAQEAPVVVRRVRIETTLESTIERATRAEGDGAPTGPVVPGDGKTDISLRQTVAFEVQSDGSRRYLQVQSDETTRTEDAEPRALHVNGALESRTVLPGIDDQGTPVLLESEGDERTELARELAEGVPVQIDLTAFVPPADARDGETVELSGDLRAAVRALLHPVVAESRRGRGRGRGFPRGMTERPQFAAWIGLLESTTAGFEAEAKFVAKKDGEPAQVRLHVVLQGEGTTQQLGMQAGGTFPGRGSRGGTEDTNEAKAKCVLDLVVRLDDRTRRAVRVDATGALESSSRVARRSGRGADTTPIETKESVVGRLTLKLMSDDAPTNERK